MNCRYQELHDCAVIIFSAALLVGGGGGMIPCSSHHYPLCNLSILLSFVAWNKVYSIRFLLAGERRWE